MYRVPFILVLLLTGCQCARAPGVVPLDTSPPDSEPLDSVPPEDTAPDRYHPDDYAEASVHGPEARLQTQACTSCHGEDLTGQGRAVGCDDCHSEGWREDCLFCHGGSENETGAPPLHISGDDDGEDAWFGVHHQHVVDTEVHAAYGCVQCHAMPADILSEGHLFLGDDTPARSETDFSGGIDTTVGWDDSQTCVSSWCHGDGQAANGRMEHDEEAAACNDCHEGLESNVLDWGDMTGEHRAHLDRGMTCKYCHADVVGDGEDIVGLSLHVNGEVDVAVIDSWVTWEGGTCDGLCHVDGFWYWHWTSGW